MLGKQIRLNRILHRESGKLLAITLDHAMARGVLSGLENIGETLRAVAAGGPDAVTMHKGIADACFAPYAGRMGLILKCTTYSPYQPTLDTPVTAVEQALRLGADAIAVGCIVGGEDQPQQIRVLGQLTDEAHKLGLPVVAHIYPRGEMIDDPNDWKAVRYAARLGAELGVDIIKTHYTGSLDTFRKVVEACPTRVAVAGGESGRTMRDYFQMTKDVIEAGGIGVTYGRFVWQAEDPAAVIRALAHIIHRGGTVDEALELLEARS